MKRNLLNKYIGLTWCGIMITANQMFAQGTKSKVAVNAETQPIHIPELLFNPNFYVLFFTTLIVLFAIGALCYSIIKLSKQLSGETKTIVEVEPVEVLAKVKKETSWHKLMHKLTRSVPVTQEMDVMLDHDYDGIRELDNPLPPWWKYGFYVTIIIGIIYLINFHVIKTGKLQAAEYAEEMHQADLEKTERMKNAADNVNEENVVRLKDATAIGEGAGIYKANCVTCHGDKGQGLVGPNLTDEYWLHGGSVKDIFRTITLGVPGKAMVSWKEKLSPKQIQQVASFVMSLQGTNPPGALPPAGEKYVEQKADNPANATADTTSKKEVKK